MHQLAVSTVTLSWHANVHVVELLDITLCSGLSAYHRKVRGVKQTFRPMPNGRSRIRFGNDNFCFGNNGFEESNTLSKPSCTIRKESDCAIGCPSENAQF